MFRNRIRRPTPAALGAAILTLSLAACGSDSPTAPGESQGTMEAVLRDDPGAAGGPAISPAQAFASGEFEANARIQVFVDGAWQDVNGLSNVEVRAGLQGGEQTMGTATVEARTYDRTRVILTNARSHLDGDTDIGVGPIGVSVTLSIAGGGEVIVEHNQPVTVEADGTTRLVLDLNSHVWISEGAVESGAVARSTFESAAAVWVQ